MRAAELSGAPPASVKVSSPSSGCWSPRFIAIVSEIEVRIAPAAESQRVVSVTLDPSGASYRWTPPPPGNETLLRSP
nr:hypothetical protein GCM10020093_028930 [Planobispora longispora]